ncbi:MAG: DJ-1/PfpI family protein [Muribaculaceae bacterium]|nr:DJ-1/PfpI family protein [Muribaculaceae bacterium]
MSNFLFLANGFEEIEALATVDVLRRAGMEVTTVSINHERLVAGAHGIEVHADVTFKEADFAGADWLILPGGMPGATHLHNHHELDALLKVHAAKGRIAAICASPAVVLAPTGLLNGKNATCYPGFEDALVAGGANPVSRRVVVDGNIVTGNGPASAIPFALEIVRLTVGDAAADQVAAGMLV